MKTEQPETEPPAQQIGGQHAQPQTQQSAETPSQQFGGVSSRERRARSNRTWQHLLIYYKTGKTARAIESTPGPILVLYKKGFLN